MQSFFLCLSALAICLISYSPSALSFVLNSKCTRKYSSSMINFQRSRPVGRTICTMSVSDEEVDAEAVDVDNDYDVSEETLDILDSEIIPELEVSETLEPEVAEVVDPYEVAVKALEAQLRTEIINIESNLKSERNALSKIKDKASESGKNGYFIVQAKVAEFQKVKAVEQKARVTRNKREFVSKMLPVVDAFRAAPSISPSTSDREESMHKNFGSLLSSIMVVFEKYGFKEFDAEIGGTLNPSRHQVSEVIDGESDGLIFSQLKRGVEDKDGEILRRALVITTKVPNLTEPMKEVDPIDDVVEEIIVEDDM